MPGVYSATFIHSTYCFCVFSGMKIIISYYWSMYARTCIPRVKNVGLLLKSSFICLNEVSRDWTSTIHLFLPRVSQTERTVNTSPGASAKHDSRAQLKLPLVGSHRALLKPYPVIRAKLRKLPSSLWRSWVPCSQACQLVPPDAGMSHWNH